MSELESRSAPGTAGEPTLLDHAIALGPYRRLVVLVPVAVAIVALLITFVVPKRYTATVRLLPPQSGASATAALVAAASARIGLGSLGGAAGSALGLKNPSDLYIGILGSTNIADAIIDRFDLMSVYGTKYREDARKKLDDYTDFSSDKSGIIEIDVQARDPKLAADVANAYVDELYRLTNSLALTDAAQHRLFFEKQLEQAKEKLADSEVAMRKALKGGGLVSVDAQGRTLIETVARLRAEISIHEVQIEAMRAFAAPENSDLVRLRREAAGLRKELAKLESGSPAPASAAGDDGVSNIRLFREVKYNETLFEMLAQQYELARASEAEQAPLIQVLDRASPPERKSWPRRGLVTLAAFAASLVISVAGAFTHDALRRANRDPVTGPKLEALKTSWSLRRRARRRAEVAPRGDPESAA